MSCFKLSNIRKVSVAQLVEYQIVVLKEVGSNHSLCFCRCRRIRSSLNLRQLCRTQCRAERRTIRRYGTAPPPPLLLGWRNTRSIILRPILFCIFGMCSPWRKSAATVRTVWHGTVIYLFIFSLDGPVTTARAIV